MASRRAPRAPGTETVDIVCGTLQVKLLTEDLSCGSCPCIQLGSRTISPCQFQREAGKASAKIWKAIIIHYGCVVYNIYAWISPLADFLRRIPIILESGVAALLFRWMI